MAPRLALFSAAGLLLPAITLFIVPAIVRWLWNLTMPEVFGLRPLTYWQAFRLVLMAWLLFGGARFSWMM
ncbi:MAG TPA: hypothetical protein VIL95_07475 [Bacillota bacterium]